MDCPVCKYPNAPGVTHCGMCHEVFNRSAAQNYIHAVKRERRIQEGNPPEPEAVIKTQHVVEEVKSSLIVVDWQAMFQTCRTFLQRSHKELLIAAGLAGFVTVLWIILSNLFSASLWYHLLGEKFVYAFPTKEPVTYLVGTKTAVRSWSERLGRLDTPLENLNWDELGNLLLEKKKGKTKNPNVVVAVRAKEWIQISNYAGGPTSRALPIKHPSLAEARLVLNKKGSILNSATPLPHA